MRNLLRALAFSLTACLFVCQAFAAPFDPGLGATIDNFLSSQTSSPMAGQGLGAVFFSQGEFFNVDPRLLVAIAGVESNYGQSNGSTLCVNDAWGSLPTPCAAGYSSYTQGIETVAAILRQQYLNQGATTISDIAGQYCSGPCPTGWSNAVEAIYQSISLATPLGVVGDLNNLTFPGSLIDFEDQYNSPDYFAAYSFWNKPLEYVTQGVTVDFWGGVTLSGATNLPGDASTTYGTAGSGYCLSTICSPEIEIDFNPPVTNFSTFLINGNVLTFTYEVYDDATGDTFVTLAPNTASGVITVAMPPTDRITRVFIDPVDGGFWDYFIDNIYFYPAP